LPINFDANCDKWTKSSQEAMNKANKGGYHIHGSDGTETYYSGANSEFSLWTRKDNGSSFMVAVEETFLDPGFWSALGRVLGYGKGQCAGKLTLSFPRGNVLYKEVDWAEYTMVRFIDHLAEGKTPTSFFAGLTSPEAVGQQGYEMAV
jgi:hypothetical protein